MPERVKPSSYRKAYNEYYPLIFSMVYTRTANREDAEDIAQEVFIRLYKNYDDVRDVRNWLFTALRFEISNYYNRKENVKKDTVDIDALKDSAAVAVQNDTPETAIIIADILAEEDNYGSEEERILFELAALYSFSFKDVAAFLGMTRWQVEYRYKKIEVKILHKLKERGITGTGDIL